MKIKTNLWSIGNGYWMIHIRKSLKKRFEEKFNNLELVNTYYDKSKIVASDYIFKKDKYLQEIKNWLKIIDN